MTKELLNIIAGFKFIAHQILEYKPRVVILGGDVFHNTEYISSMTLYGSSIALKAVKDACDEVGARHIIIPGNHDILSQSSEFIVTSIANLTGYGDILLKKNLLEIDGFNIGFVPYSRDTEMAYIDLCDYQSKADLLVTHLDFSGAYYDTGKESLSTLSPDFDVPVLAGDLHCFSSDTEILTDRGWLFYSDLTKSDRVMTLNKKSRKLELNKINSFIEKEVDEDCINIKSKCMDMLVTNEHRMLCWKQHKEDEIQIKTASELFDKSREDFILPISGNLDSPEYKIEDDIIRLIVWVVTDGCIETKIKSDGVSRSLSGVRWELRKKRKIKILTELLDTLDIPFSFKDSRCEGKKIRLSNHDDRTQYIWKLFPDTQHKLLPEFFRKFSIRQKKIVFDTYLVTDGNPTCDGRGIQISTSKKVEADLLQELSVTIGYSCNLSPRVVSGSIYYTMSIIYNRQGTYLSPRKGHYIETPYAGKVWCLNVDNDTLMVRRNGMVAITGNCKQTTGSVVYPGSLVQQKFNKYDLEDAGGLILFDMNDKSIKHVRNTFSKHYVKFDYDNDFEELPSFKKDEVLLQVFSEESKEDLNSIFEGYDWFYIKKFKDKKADATPVSMAVEDPKRALRDYIENDNEEALDQYDRVMHGKADKLDNT